VALNVNNALDQEYKRANRLMGEERSVFLTYTVGRTSRNR
jgi:hypothetical protein